ncbi:ornithine--oxo-acid transaminase [candidate division WOR-3 bacterium]|uniref:ornithine aminotransferase n=1 Tax=candidate division WOR-3 bacterium TaxID=2052148 RepID=A0A9D5K781_UNCW3|nr:ornithine--oxo-acid transaminase [candidate division WOR-3 bacterium]MBD3363578.1 ornithine--oxo-acid transaminase [candidate division WOR-3 bacterium]
MSKTKEILTQTEKYSANNYHPLDVVLSRGEGIWVWDVDGNKYMDCLAAYSAVNQGHRHQKVLDALIKQTEHITLTSRAFHNDRMGEFLHKLCEVTGKEKALPMNTGAEAVETAIKAVRKWGYEVKGVEEGKAEIITCSGNFHGRTTTIVGFSTEAQYKDGFGPFTPGFVTVPYGDIKSLEDAITPNTVAFLFEPLQGEGGVVVPPEGYIKKAAEICKQKNVLMVADEIQTGLGRTGKMFCCDHEEVVPDVYILGKALGGGVYPVSGIACDDDIMGVFHPGDHGSTFGGNPLGSAVGLASLNVLIDEKLPAKAADLGKYFMEELNKIESPHVDHIRGKGLMIGVVIKESSGTARPFCEKLRDLGVLAKETHHQVIRFAPPLVITKDEIDWALERIEKVLK